MSLSTTNLGPKVSINTTNGLAHDTSDYAVLDLAGARLLSRVTTASVTSLVVGDGEFMITNLATGASAAAVLAFRSGNTTYRWSSTTATVV